jgi:sigma-B regulation protein RsbU (phosphoserine phosphatase)
MIKLSGLQQRLALYMFLPVALLLAGMGIAGFVYARNSLITEWGEAANLKLQREHTRWTCGLAGPRNG